MANTKKNEAIMKKTFFLFSAMAMLLCGLIFTGCDKDEDDFFAPKDTWVYKKSSTTDYSFEYKWKSGKTEGSEETEKTINLDAYIYYASQEKTLSVGQTELNLKEGINLILLPVSETQNETLKDLLNAADVNALNNIYIFKSYGKTVNAEDDSSKEKSIEVGTVLWNIVYLANNFETYSDSTFNNIMKGKKSYNDSVDNLKNLNFSRVIYNLLGEKLFSE